MVDAGRGTTLSRRRLVGANHLRRRSSVVFDSFHTAGGNYTPSVVRQKRGHRTQKQVAAAAALCQPGGAGRHL